MSESKNNKHWLEEECLERTDRELLLSLLSEIRQPLSSASGYTALLKRDFENGQPEETASYVQPLVNSIEAMNEMVMAYLECLKKKAGETK
jgi:signal transduction histidine kinase